MPLQVAGRIQATLHDGLQVGTVLFRKTFQRLLEVTLNNEAPKRCYLSAHGAPHGVGVGVKAWDRAHAEPCVFYLLVIRDLPFISSRRSMNLSHSCPCSPAQSAPVRLSKRWWLQLRAAPPRPCHIRRSRIDVIVVVNLQVRTALPASQHCQQRWRMAGSHRNAD